VILGVVKDYLVDYGSNEFTINLAGVTPTTIRDHLIDFVRRSQPNSEQTVEEIMSERITTLDDSINTFGQFLVRFVYQTIERSRRRSLREMWLAVIECSEGEELRQRILDYLTEGDLGPILEELLDSAAPLDAWMTTWPTRSSGISEIREWRGSSARLLTSYPDNSALLITRALVEALDEDVETTAEFDSNMIAGISRAFSANIDSEEIERAIKGIFVKIENSSFGERAADSVFASLLIRNDLESETLKDYVSKHWKEHPDMMIYYLSEKLNESHQITQELLSSE
jgi:hypothetical protein